MGTLTNTMSALLWIAFHLANRSHCAKLGSGVPGITLAGHRNLSDMWHPDFQHRHGSASLRYNVKNLAEITVKVSW